MIRPSSQKNERGLSLLETVFAAFVMLVGISGVMSLFTVAAMKNASQGTQATRCTEYAQDKVEQLMALPFADADADTTVIPTCDPDAGMTGCNAGGTGLKVGGSTTTATTGYVDYITEGNGSGNAVYSTQQSSSNYARMWSIATDANGNKTITVVVKSLRVGDISAAGQNLAPSTSLVSVKTNF
ncbi:MAG TPA: hypothetical protein VMU24_00445 [Candidatus Acidoferrales bacterium]|nr:hypothetical protein [Candidatus Acidoferrales bacterium]